MGTMFVKVIKAVVRGGVRLAEGTIMLVVGQTSEELVRVSNSKGETVDLHTSEYVEIKRRDQQP